LFDKWKSFSLNWIDWYFQPQRLNWNEDNKIYSPSERTSELKNDLLLAQSAPKELQVTAVHSTQPKTVIVSSCDILLNERQSSMVWLVKCYLQTESKFVICDEHVLISILI